MERNIWVYGNPDKSKLGFPMPGDLTQYISSDVFEEENGRYRYTQGKNADIIVLSRDGLAYGHFDIDDKVKPTDADRKAYPRVRYVYLVRKSSLYRNPVPLSSLSIAGLSFGHRLSETKFKKLQKLAGKVTEYHKMLALPHSVVELERVLCEVQRRLRQSEFRKSLVAAYKGKCAISGYDAVDALEAAHIAPISEAGESELSNGLLLRADIHTLFDRDQIGVNPDSLVVAISEKLSGTCYEQLAGRPISLPDAPSMRPEHKALATKWKSFQQNG